MSQAYNPSSQEAEASYRVNLKTKQKKGVKILLYSQPHRKQNFTVSSSFIFLHGFNFQHNLLVKYES